MILLLKSNDKLLRLNVKRNKAKKYKVELERFKRFWKFRWAKHQIGSYDEHKERIKSKFNEMKAKETQLNQEIEDLSELLVNEGNYLSELEQKINEFHADAIKLDGQIDLNRRQIEFNP